MVGYFIYYINMLFFSSYSSAMLIIPPISTKPADLLAESNIGSLLSQAPPNVAYSAFVFCNLIFFPFMH